MKKILVMFLALGLLVTFAHRVLAQDAPAENAPAAAAPAPAENAPAAAAPAPAENAPAPAAPAEAPPAAPTTETAPAMPHTASPIPLVGLSGLAAFGAALALRLKRK